MDEHSKAGPKAEEKQKKQPEKRTRIIQPVELTLGACGAKFKNPQEENRGLNVLSLLHCHPAVVIMLLFLRPSFRWRLHSRERRAAVSLMQVALSPLGCDVFAFC